MNGDAQLRLFVYGTLKRGFDNHRRLCQGVRSVQEAEIRGKLYGLPVGYPALVIPQAGILSIGSADAAADVVLQRRLQDAIDSYSQAAPGAGGSGAGWDRVRGEILTFDDPPRRLPKFDHLENFRPGRHSSYLRVLVQVLSGRHATPVVVWVYVMRDPGPRARRLRSGRWPEE